MSNNFDNASTIADIKQSVAIEDIIGEFLPDLKKVSSNTYKALSPLTGEKTASFTVFVNGQRFVDYSAGKSGDVFTFLKEYQNMSFPEALEYLSAKAGIPLPKRRNNDPFAPLSDLPVIKTDPAPLYKKNFSPPKRLNEIPLDQRANELDEDDYITLKKNYGKLNEQACAFYQELCLNGGTGSLGLEFWRLRGYSMEAIQKWRLGYAPDAYHNLEREFVKRGWPRKMLHFAGLIAKKEKENQGTKYYDRYRGRVIIPIISLQGNVIGFGGRLISKREESPKYINSPRTLLYNKSRTLFGIYYAMPFIKETKKAILVEGYTDVMSLHERGLQNVVASCGTAVTPEQIMFLSKTAEEIICLFDGDSAGLKASLKAFMHGLSTGVEVKAVLLPDGMDPDDIADKWSLEQINDYIETNKMGYIEFYFKTMAKDIKEMSPRESEKIYATIGEVLSEIKKPQTRAAYLAEFSKYGNIPLKSAEDILSYYTKVKEDKALRQSLIDKQKNALEADINDPETVLLSLVIERSTNYYLETKKYDNKPKSETDRTEKVLSTIDVEYENLLNRKAQEEPEFEVGKTIIDHFIENATPDLFTRVETIEAFETIQTLVAASKTVNLDNFKKALETSQTREYWDKNYRQLKISNLCFVPLANKYFDISILMHELKLIAIMHQIRNINIKLRIGSDDSSLLSNLRKIKETLTTNRHKIEDFLLSINR